MKNLLISILIPLFGTFLALGAVEGIYRWTGTRKVAQWSDRPIFYVKAKSAATMQGPSYVVPKPENVYRIAVIGDSFSFAPYMQFTDTFAHKLQEYLNLNGGPRQAEVINYGVPAYSTSHEVDVAGRALDEGADLILLQITLNDPELKIHTPTGITENMNDAFGPFEPQGALKTTCSIWKSLCWVLQRLHNNKTRTSYVDYFNGLYTNPRTWNPFVSAMRDLVKKPKRRNIPIVAVIFPLFGLQMDKNYPLSGAHEKVRKLMESLKVPVTDISSIFMDIPLERLQVIPGVDRHPNEIAHRMSAEYLYLWLEKLDLIPPDLRIEEMYATRLGTIKQRKLEARPVVP